LLGLGMGVGATAAIGMMIGFRPSTLPDAMLDLAAYKLAFTAALGLLAAGALFLRHSRRTTASESLTSANVSAGTPGAINPPAVDAINLPQRTDAERVRRNTPE
jgi:hypothetical protein